MTTYIDVPVTTDPDGLAELSFDRMQAQIPGWVPAAGNLETILIEAIAQQASVVATLAAAVPTSIFRYFGGLVGIDPLEATPATVSTTWTMKDTAGYTIPAGMQVGFRIAGDDLVAFTVVSTVVVPSGSGATSAGQVLLEAVNPGASGSGLGGAGSTMELLNPLDYVTAITMVDQTLGGVDAETDDAYLNRLASELRLLTPRPILPEDFAALSASVAGVARALPLDGYNPVDQTFGNARMVAVALVNESGQPVSTETAQEVAAMLEADREVNFVVSAVQPTYTSVDVSFTATVAEGFDPASVQADADNAIANYLNPATWGVPQAGDPGVWVNTPTVGLLDMAAVIKNVPGIAHVTSILMAVSGSPLTAADVTLTGAAPLPTPGAIAGTVT